MTMPNENRVEQARTRSLRSSTRSPSRNAPNAAAAIPREGLGLAASIGSPAAVSGTPTTLGRVMVTMAAAAESAAVNQRAEVPPTVPISSAAIAGPTMVVSESKDCDMPMNRCRSTPSRLVTVGSRASRAVMPGMSPTAPIRPKTTNHQKFKPQIISTMGMSATLAADIKSERMEMFRRLKRSSAAPPRTPSSICGTAHTSARAPAASASPVVASRMRGSAMAAIELPRSESVLETRKRMVVPLPCMIVLSASVIYRAVKTTT